MSYARVIGLLVAYFSQPYVEYGELALAIRSSGGLTSDEVQHIKSKLLSIDAKAIIRHAGTNGRSPP